MNTKISTLRNSEFLLHTFFGKECLNIDVYDKQGKRFSPREWFIASLHIIEAAADMLISARSSIIDTTRKCKA